MTLDLTILSQLGIFTKNLRKEVSKLVLVNKTSKEVIDFIEKKIFEKGYLPAFPAMIAVNEQAAHYTVFGKEDYIFQKGDVIKVDFGVSYQGYITDNAFTVEIETNEYSDLLEANKKALDKALEVAQVGVSMSKIGAEVHAIAKEYGVESIHNLSGHEIGRFKLHYGLSVPNYENGDEAKIGEETQLAIEPFFTRGVPRIVSKGPCNILHLINDKPVRDPIAKKVLLHIKENYPHLPFSKRWLVKSVAQELGISWSKGCFDEKKVLYALRILKRENIIYEYDILVSQDGSYISQFEDTIVFKDSKKLIVTRFEEDERS